MTGIIPRASKARSASPGVVARASPLPRIGFLPRTDEHGGHPGDAQHSAIIRWTAPSDMTVVISGQLKYDSEQGDGVMAVVWSSQLGERARWIAHKQSANTFVAATPVRRSIRR